jgi:hypothetical protein
MPKELTASVFRGKVKALREKDAVCVKEVTEPGTVDERARTSALVNVGKGCRFSPYPLLGSRPLFGRLQSAVLLSFWLVLCISLVGLFFYKENRDNFSFETVANVYQAARCHIPENIVFYNHRRDKLNTRVECYLRKLLYIQ